MPSIPRFVRRERAHGLTVLATPLPLDHDLKITVPKAPWSAVAAATAFWLGFQGGSFAAALHGALRIFLISGSPSADGNEGLP